MALSLKQISPTLRLCYGGVGTFGLFWALAAMVAPNQGEVRDWVFFFLVFLVAPLVFARATDRLQSRFMVSLGLLYCAVVAGDHVSHAARQFWFWVNATVLLKSLPVFLKHVVALLSALGIAALHSVLLFLALKCLVGRQLNLAQRLWLMPLLLVLLGVFEDRGLFFWLALPGTSNSMFWNIVFVFLLATWLRPHFAAPAVAFSRKWDFRDWCWLGVFAFCLRLPLTSSGYALLHHWSFYVGTIETVRNGGLLLYDTPSQYGFLSIALPAAFSIPSVDAFWVSLMALLTLHFLVVYGSLRNLTIFSHGRFLSGLLALSLVLFLGGSRDHHMGVFEAPSTSAYRFFWSFALALALANEPLGALAKARLRAGLVSLLFTLGCLWSGESAIYCLGVLCGAIAGGLLKYAATRVRKPVAWAWTPFVSLGGATVFVELLYRFRFGVRPDWWGLFEYSLAYGGGFGALPIQFFSSGCGILLAILAGAGFVLAGSLRAGDHAGNGFAVWGFLITTFTYFVSRSHPSNALNLLCYWLPLLLILVDRKAVLATERQLKALFYFVFVMVFVWSFPRFPGVGVRVWMLAQVPLSKRMETVIDEPSQVGQLQALGLTSQDALVDLANTLPELKTPSFPFRPFYPIYPALEFLILSAERQAVYFERFFSRNEKRSVYLLWSVPETSERARRFTKLLETHGYSAHKARNLPGNQLLQGFSVANEEAIRREK
jgi:hypothetical protein